MHDAKTHLSRHLAAMKGDDRIIICNRNQPVAEVRLLPRVGERDRPAGVAKGEFTVPAAFFASRTSSATFTVPAGSTTSQVVRPSSIP
jgi:antitoxin (DNA-binding transcriptional repressor) of toxin-antitoxin stability system